MQDPVERETIIQRPAARMSKAPLSRRDQRLDLAPQPIADLKPRRHPTDLRRSTTPSSDSASGHITLHSETASKWHSATTPRKDLDAFAAKIADKIENTLGLFLSINGFEATAVTKHSGKGAAMILMDGLDLYAVLEGRIDLVELLRRKYRHAAQTGEILLSVSTMVAG